MSAALARPGPAEDHAAAGPLPLDEVPVPLWATDAGGRTVSVNRALRDWLGQVPPTLQDFPLRPARHGGEGPWGLHPGEATEAQLPDGSALRVVVRARGAGGWVVVLLPGPGNPALPAEEQALAAALRDALAADGLQLHVQPQRDLLTGGLAGAEALLRWHVPALGGWIPPDRVLRAAAASFQLRSLDAWVVRAAARLQRAWRGRPGAPRCLGLNISAETLRDPGFAEVVADALRREGLAPHALEVEIPETIAVRDLHGVGDTLAALRGLGVKLALDDFGAGQSSLTHVVNLPIHRIKLDRALVSRLPDDPRAYAILRATMAMARGLRIEVVAEGVETKAQADAVQRLGCHVIQGWLVARAMPPEELLRAVSGCGG